MDHSTWIAWGEPEEIDADVGDSRAAGVADPEGEVIDHYEFATAEELEAFLLGCRTACGNSMLRVFTTEFAARHYVRSLAGK